MPSMHARTTFLIAMAVAAALALGACRPADAPKEPTEPTEPTVGARFMEPGGQFGAMGARRVMLARK